MTKTLDPALLTQAQADAQAPVLLVEISGWGGSTVRWAGTDADVIYGGDVYDARPLSVGGVQVSTGGEPQRLDVSVANQDLAVSTLCAAASPVGASVRLLRVFLDDLSVAQTVAAAMVVHAYRLSETRAVLHCATAASLLHEQLPRRTFDRTCPWEFKGPECAYAGAATSCDHTDETCKSYDNFANFGGFLFVLPRRF